MSSRDREPSNKLTHFDEEGRSRMVDVSGKPITEREAVAKAVISMRPETFNLIREGRIEKGDVYAVAKIAGIMAAKRTDSLIPMCHPLQLTSADVKFFPHTDSSRVEIEATVRTIGRTGVEMEALLSASVAALTIYDMCKAVDREMEVHDVCLLSKKGGASGEFMRRK